ncbi:MAG: DUF4258 domain-containing protein [Nanoarchaeota archaeon]
MAIVLTNHARKRMAQRVISFRQIEETIEMPDYTVQKGDKTEAIKKHNNRKIKVIYSSKDRYKKVISVM